MYFVFIIYLSSFQCISLLYYLFTVFLEMPHHCIVPLCTNSSHNNPELSFNHLPLHDKKLLQRWLVNIRRVNTNVNEHSRVCSAHSKEARNREKMLHPQYLHGLKYPPLEHIPRNAALLLQLQLHIPLALQHIYIQRIM